MGFYATFVRLAWPLTGRTEEMQAIQAAISAADLTGVLVCGPAGVGKSRIAREALSAAASNGCEVRWAVATSSSKTLPLGAFASWADTDFSDSLQLVRGAIESLQADHSFLLRGDVFNEDFIANWIDMKQKEYDALRLRPHPYEFAMYYDV